MNQIIPFSWDNSIVFVQYVQSILNSQALIFSSTAFTLGFHNVLSYHNSCMLLVSKVVYIHEREGES